MAFSYNIDEVSPPELPSVQHDIRQAKKFLMRHSSESNSNLYDHLSELLEKILTERPKNAVDVFEEYSKQLKNERMKINTRIREVYIPPQHHEESQQLIELFKSLINEESKININNENLNKSKKSSTWNLLEFFYYLQQIDINLPRSEIILIDLSIRKLIKEKPIINVRFWGKILGRPKNYYIVEAELGEEELSRRHKQFEADKQHEMKLAQVQDDDGIEMSSALQKDNANVEVNVGGGGDDGRDNGDEKKKSLDLVFPPTPRSNWKPPPVVPTEQIGMGLNKMVYFVCNSPGLDEWIELMSVTPQQIVAARQIVRCFTGCLETPINTYPVFPGNEGNYLRAQIARISGSTHVSPIGYFIFGKEIDDEEVEEEEDEMENKEIEKEENGDAIIKNQHYDIVPVKDLVDPSMSNWCHHSEYILEQGRTTWWDVLGKDENEETLDDEAADEEKEQEEDDEEEEEEDEMEDGMLGDERNKNKKEIGPPLLTPLSEDTDVIDTMRPAWTARLSSEIQPESAIAMIRSNIWPGAFAFAKDKVFGNIYIGGGLKYNGTHYCPPMMPLIQDQYKIGPEIMEVQDNPSVEAEKYRREHYSKTELRTELSEEEDDEEDDEDDEDDEIDN
ncbi:hypothetical protein PV328_002914 [Microctonus aethiopoides]|uniref:Uncharacterized protein n=1 Tax=Microctonus aethiopoides TaxID=144406 RepID=A0AA39F796_9HYME|nr:hypothetical protein PV328_002914 [Microctonus aethiopoides]